MADELLYNELMEGGDRVVAIGCQPMEVDERLLCGVMFSDCLLHIDWPIGSKGDESIIMPNAAVEDFERIRG